jgi:FKBP-type peptidyl-prolyl cis-trans isomerase
MREGGERIIVVPSAFGYGNAIVPGVPPNSTLVFDVILNQV